MKKRIAVFANGWSHLAIEQSLKGIKSVTDELDVDVFLFLSYASYSQSDLRVSGEDAIFDLPDYSDFDGAILFSNMFNSQNTPQKIANKIIENQLKAVSVGIPMKGLSFVGFDNFTGMYDMVDHLVKEHHIKNPVFFGGSKDHPDSNERLSATLQALQANGIQLAHEKVFYTDWEYLPSIKYATELCNNPNPPDAFICANDSVAIAVCVALKKLGYKVPKDFIVTGFDNISFAETFYPSITTVYQDYEKMGSIAATQLMKQIKGIATSDKEMISSNFLRNESCGCKKEQDAEEVRHDFCISAYTKQMDSLIFQGNELTMTNLITGSSCYDELKTNVLNYYQNHRTFGERDFFIILDSDAQKNLISSSNPVAKKFSDKMNCLVSVKNGKASAGKEFERRELIPGYKKGKKAIIYTFTSLHYDDNIFGYVVLCDAVERIKDTTLNHFMVQVNNSIEQFRKKSELKEMNTTLKNISNTDQLTGLNNRFGMECNGVPLMETAHKQKKVCAVVFIDINQMKYINDNFGHLQGDLAIRTVASSILSEMPKKWIGIRYGGDEFIALGVCDDKKFAEDYIERIKTNLERQVSSMRLSYPLSISCGYVLTDTSSPLTLEDYISLADDYMYEHKQKIKKQTNPD